MKHTLPVLTLTALAAAASAQVAPAAKQSLSYNRVVASWVSTSSLTGGYNFTGMSVFAQAKLGGGLYVSATADDLNTTNMDGSTAVLGWAYTLPSILGAVTDLNLEVGYKTAGVGIRSLIGGGFELDVSYAHGAGMFETDVLNVGASYSLGFLVKGLSLNASYASETSNFPWRPGFDTTSVGIGYNF